jgi:hypothetical protein
LIAGREADLTPYVAEMVPAVRGFEQSFAAYVAAFLERNPVAMCP